MSLISLFHRQCVYWMGTTGSINLEMVFVGSSAVEYSACHAVSFLAASHDVSGLTQMCR